MQCKEITAPPSRSQLFTVAKTQQILVLANTPRHSCLHGTAYGEQSAPTNLVMNIEAPSYREEVIIVEIPEIFFRRDGSRNL